MPKSVGSTTSRYAVLLGNLSGSLVWVVRLKKNCSPRTAHLYIILLCVTYDTPFAFRYEYALAVASCRPVALCFGGGAHFDALC